VPADAGRSCGGSVRFPMATAENTVVIFGG
jgi:hypothetical protein